MKKFTLYKGDKIMSKLAHLTYSVGDILIKGEYEFKVLAAFTEYDEAVYVLSFSNDFYKAGSWFTQTQLDDYDYELKDRDQHCKECIGTFYCDCKCHSKKLKEEVKEKCRHCGEWLDFYKPESTVTKPKPSVEELIEEFIPRTANVRWSEERMRTILKDFAKELGER